MAGERNYSKYVYTAQNEETIQLASKELEAYENIEYKILDISKDPKSQDFDLSSFDLIIANRTLHMSSHIQDTFQNIHKLIKPSGRLLIQELSPSANFYKFVMGFTPEWWRDTEDDRMDERLHEVHQWHNLLLDAGFSGSEGLIIDDDHITANILTTAATHIHEPGKVTLLGHPHSQDHTNALSELLSEMGYEVEFRTLSQEPDPEADVISLLDFHDTMFFEMTEDTFNSWQNYLGKFPAERGLLWVTGPAKSDHRILGTQPPLAQLEILDPRFR